MKKILIILILLTTQIFAETKNDNQKIFTAIKGNNVDYISLLIKNKANLSEVFDDEEIIAAINSIKAVAQFFDQNPGQLKKAEMLRELTDEESKLYLDNK